MNQFLGCICGVQAIVMVYLFNPPVRTQVLDQTVGRRPNEIAQLPGHRLFLAFLYLLYCLVFSRSSDRQPSSDRPTSPILKFGSRCVVFQVAQYGNLSEKRNDGNLKEISAWGPQTVFCWQAT